MRTLKRNGWENRKRGEEKGLEEKYRDEEKLGGKIASKGDKE